MKKYILKVTYWDGFEVTRDELYCVDESTKKYIVDDNKHLGWEEKQKAVAKALSMCYMYNTIDDEEKLLTATIPRILSGAQSEDEENEVAQAMQFIYNMQK
jgi:hypothetical protein